MAVMLVGGFHTPQVTALLKKSGVSFAVVQPQITKLEDATGTEYLSIFSKEKTSLEQLFEGKKLFLAPSGELAGNKAGAFVGAETLAVSSGAASLKPATGCFPR